MSRDLSAQVYAALYSQATDEIFVELLTVNHEDLDAPLYWQKGGSVLAPVTSRGNDYDPFDYSLPAPPQEEGMMPRVELILGKVSNERHQLLVQMVELIRTPINFTYEVVLLSAPNTLVFGPWEFQSREVRYNRVQVRATLQFEPIGDLMWPPLRITPGNFPGTFNAVA